MNLSHSLNNPGRAVGRLKAALAFALGVALVGGPTLVGRAENTNSMIKPPKPMQGGLGLFPIVLPLTRTQDLVTVRWFGIQGPYQLFRAPASNSKVWEPLGEPTFGTSQTVPVSGASGFFVVRGGRPVSGSATNGTVNYVGAAACVQCHESSHHSWMTTSHAKAFDALKGLKQQANSTCLPCHTVGFGTPIGYQSETATPHLTGVQCESCHGPGGGHISNVRDVSLRPKVTIAAEVCGGCHTDYPHRDVDQSAFGEWSKSKHAAVDLDVATSIQAQGEARMLACGPCHSGAVRNALLGQLENPHKLLPSREDAAYFGVTCVVCHDPHAKAGPVGAAPVSLLRNPLYSTNHFSYSTATTTTFAAQYKPAIQVCAQCHNMRGARWQDTSRPPHHSPQYNILIGQGGEGPSLIAAHGLAIQNQCVRCHIVSDQVNSGHKFEVPANAAKLAQNCSSSGCHDGKTVPVASPSLIAGSQGAIRSTIAGLKGLLDQWAATKAPPLLQSTNNYGALAWEYNIPGALSNPTNDPLLRGPTTAEQARIPESIKKARMNLYLVQYDGSFGVHNPGYARGLLDASRMAVNAELAKP